jgi:type I restriction-modification system DNA methylase subunit
MADYKNYTLEELIEHCKSINIPYMSKRNKVYIEKTLIKNIRKYENTMREALGDINEIIVSQEEDAYDEKLNVIVNEIIWTISKKNVVIDDKYKNIKDNLQQVIKMCHNILYGNAIVGVKAQNDIMKILTIHIFKSQFADENSELFKICKKFLNDGEMSQERYDKYMGYCKNIKEFLKTDNPLNEWRMFIMSFAIKIFKNSIYNEEDCRFSFNDEASFMKLIDVICKIEINEDFVDAFATSYGDVHEAFREYGGGKGSKELGQFFSPRHLINIIFHGCGFNDIIKSYENPTIYDCCMGTGGLLTRAYSNGNIIPNNIYGCEVEKDTIKFGECSIFLTTNNFNSNIIKCDSLCENPYLITNKFDIIFTNPPFGTSMNYKALQKRFDYFKKDDTTRFKDIYPISDNNNGTGLFIQHCIYMLKEGGVCAIILPYGELFDSKSFIKLRKYMCESVNILKIIYVPPKTFSHTSIETAVIIFKKEGSTKNIEFMEITTKECESIKSNMIVPIKNIKNNNYNFKISSYTKTEQIQYGEGVVIKTLGEVCKFDIGGTPSRSKNEYYENGNNLWVSVRELNGGYIYDTKEKITDLGVQNSSVKLFAKDTILFSFKLSIGKTAIVGNPLYTNEAIAGILSKNNDLLNNKYLYYYLTINDFSKLGSGMLGNGSLNKKSLEQIKIPIPSLERQEEIIKDMDEISNSIDTIKLRVKQLKYEGELFKKKFYLKQLNDIFKESEIKTLGELFKLNGNGKTNSKDITNTGEYPFYKASCNNPSGTHNTFDFDGKEYLLIIKSGGSSSKPISENYGIGKVFEVNGKCAANIAVFQLLPKTNNNFKYLSYYLKSIQNKIQGLAKYCTNNGNIDMKELMEIKIPIPSLERQEEIIGIYENITEEHKKNFLDKIEQENQHIEMLKKIAISLFNN